MPGRTRIAQQSTQYNTTTTTSVESTRGGKRNAKGKRFSFYVVFPGEDPERAVVRKQNAVEWRTKFRTEIRDHTCWMFDGGELDDWLIWVFWDRGVSGRLCTNVLFQEIDPYLHWCRVIWSTIFLFLHLAFFYFSFSK